MSLLRMSGVDKRFGGVQALRAASLVVERGEIHGLLGPNGSGKSTLNKILAGTVRPDRATITIDDDEVTISSPKDAHERGIAAVYQQLSVIPDMTVAENLVLGVETHRAGFITNRGAAAARDSAFEMIRPVLAPEVELNTPVRRLSPGDRQLVEFAKVVLRAPRILVLDEATASLHSDQVEVLIERTKELAASGTAVIVVSHRMDEVRRLCDRATILRSGRVVATVDMATTDDARLVDLMVGETLERAQREHHAPSASAPVLAVDHLSGHGFHDITFEARPGEVIGLGGLQGQGQSDLLHAIFGATPAESGSIRISGHDIRPRRPRDGMRHGIALVPGDRGSQGLMSQRSIMENLAVTTLADRLVAHTWVSPARERRSAREQVDRLAIKIGGLDDPVSTLSGGNQQKVVLGKWLAAAPVLVLLDDPTKGVDVGAKGEIYSIINRMTEQGAVVILNSSDDEELVSLCDRVLVMYEGGIRAELAGSSITRAALVAHAIAPGGEAATTPTDTERTHA